MSDYASPYALASEIVVEHLLAPNGLPYEGPRLHPCVCGCGVALHVGKLNKGKCRTPSCRCQRFREDTDWRLAYEVVDADRTGLMQSMRKFRRNERELHMAANPRLPGTWSLGPSDAGKCRRAIWYRNMPPAGLVRAWSDRNKADIGDMLHEEAVRRLQALYPWRDHEMWVHVKGLDRPGRLDSFDAVTGTVEDIKTHGDYIANVVDDDGALLEHWKQDSLYALALEESGQTVRWLKLTYVHRDPDRGPMERPFRRPYNRDFAEAARQELLEIASALDLVHAETEAKRTTTGDAAAWVDPDDLDVLPRDRKGPSTDKICENCEFRKHCWSIDEAAENGRSPESWTNLGDGAEATDETTGYYTDEATVWALTNVHELAQLAKQTGQSKDEAEADIQGLPKGRYGLRGELTVWSQNHGGRTQYKDYADALKANAALPEDKRKPVDEIEIPKGAPSPKTHVKKTSAATLEKEAERRGEVIQLPTPQPETGGAA